MKIAEEDPVIDVGTLIFTALAFIAFTSIAHVQSSPSIGMRC